MVLTGAAAVALLVGCAPLHASAPPPGVRMEPTRTSLFARPWTWTDETGNPVTLSRWRGETTVVTGIYTRCKSTCPRTIARLRKLQDDFVRERRPAQFVLVTLEPTVDTPQALLRFKSSAGLPGAWRLLTGSAKDTQELSEALDIHVLDDGPHFMHDGKIVVLDTQGVPTRSLGGWALTDQPLP